MNANDPTPEQIAEMCEEIKAENMQRKRDEPCNPHRGDGAIRECETRTLPGIVRRVIR